MDEFLLSMLVLALLGLGVGVIRGVMKRGPP